MEAILSTSRNLAFSLVWGGWMLFILGWWVGTKHEELARVWVMLIWILAALSFGCGLWQYLTVTRPAPTPEEKQAALIKQRKMLALAVILGGLVLIGLGIYLAVQFRLAAFGEFVGMLLVGLIAAQSGYSLLIGTTSTADVHPFFDLLRRQHAQFGLVLLALSGALILTALGLLFLAKLGTAWFPEMGGLFLLGCLGISGGIWLTLAQGAELTTAKMRVFVLVMGGVAGLILSLGALARALVWREDVFGGMRAWQGERGWQLWLCAYVELIGLALMFASLLLARTDIRSSAVLRRVLYGYNAVLTGLLLLAMLVVLNIVLFALFPFSFEWSKSRGAHTLSTSSKNLLASLQEPTTIYVLIPKAALFTEVRNFLENCQNASSKVEVKYISPDKDLEEFKGLVDRFPDSLSGKVGRMGAVDRGILIVYGSLPADATKKVPHAFIPTSRLTEQQPPSGKEGKGVVLFKGESEVMTELGSLVQDRKKRKVYVLQGNGELDVNDQEDKIRRDLRVELEPLGAHHLAEALKKDQFDVQGLSFGTELAKSKTTNLIFAKESGPEKRKEVPDDAEVVLIPGPSATLGPKVLDALERYMDRGGRLVVYLDIVVDAKANRLKTSGLEEFLRKYGVLVGTEFAMRVPEDTQDDPRGVYATVPADTTNPLAKAFLRKPIELHTARIIKPDKSAQKYKADVILQLDPKDLSLERRQNYWEETAIRALASPITYAVELMRQGALETRLSGEPLPVAVAVSEKLMVPGSTKETFKPRLLVFGDAEMISNVGILQGRVQPGNVNYAWTASGLEWISEKRGGQIGPRPREANTYGIDPNTVNVARMRYLPVWLMTLGILGLGAGIWVVRRR